ncbi:uncharacterized protein A1O9_01449 [Exophiala aquamarina CBS 119918]|uniref:Methyltransferase small domain-containing protein n=1 Tax=Exophiala aquamarina CBS 119918 TaxID=1182545 RepID=A0A072PUD7_9EURO|nr:uncharacterized protein A1O9_01449 [Exophiala aquamarina CBS 119918]KEF63471.1 hypothetical protein A1O9_01449 [Exophiala aquamarina CBS 119918]
MLLPTPSTSHVSYDNVYEPSEDSYLFLDTLSSGSETQWLQSRFSAGSQRRHHAQQHHHGHQRQNGNRVPLLVELGPGSGVIVAFLTAHAREVFGSDVLSLSIDVNWHACQATRTTVELAIAEGRGKGVAESAASAAVSSSPSQQGPNSATTSKASPAEGAATATMTTSSSSSSSTYLTSMRGDLSSALKPHSVDVMVFNPPYVPTESVPSLSPATEPAIKPTFEESSHLLAQSYAGGLDGMEVTERMLSQLPEALSARGVAYVLFCRGNRPEEVKRRIRSWETSELEGGDNGEEVEGGGGGDGDGDGDGGGRTRERMQEKKQWQWHAETVGESGKTAGWEKLEIVRIWRE